MPTLSNLNEELNKYYMRYHAGLLGNICLYYYAIVQKSPLCLLFNKDNEKFSVIESHYVNQCKKKCLLFI